MPVQTELREIVFQGLKQKDARLRTLPGELEVAENLEFDKVGEFNKRRGYRRLETLGVFNEAVDLVYANVAVYRGELVVFSPTRIWSIASPESAIGAAPDRAFVLRGPTCRGALRVHNVATSSDVET